MAKTHSEDIPNAELLEVIQSGFQNMEDRFQGLEGRMGGLEGKVGEMDNRLSGRIEEMDDRLTGRIDNLTTAVDGLAKRHLDFDEALVMERSARERLEDRVEIIESKTI